MKILIIIILLLSTGCNKKEEIKKENIIKPKETIKEENKIEKEEYIDDNPIIVGLYQNNNLVKEINKKFKDGIDIGAFSVAFTNKEKLESTKAKTNYQKYIKEYENIENYKIGFEVSFMVNDKLYENIILDPSTKHKLHPYLYVYLYDDIHAQGYYSHLEKKDVKEDTIYSTIKLYIHQKTNEITSDIKLKVFTYKSNNDFQNGHYRGKSYYEITIKNK